MKTCAACHQEKGSDAFYRQGGGRGLMGVCKGCHKAAVKLRRRTNPAVQAYDRERAKRPDRKAHNAANARRFREANPLAYTAQTAVNNALRDGRLTREPCLFCATIEHVHGHHRDYSKPLEVVWLCAKCHHRLHATFPETAGHEHGDQAEAA